MDDLISRQTAIEAIKLLFPDMPKIEFMDNRRAWRERNKQYLDALDAIRSIPAVDAQPNLQSTCNQLATDCISRKAAIDALSKLDVSDGVGISSVACNLQEEAIRSIENLPSADVAPVRHGTWIEDRYNNLDYVCSECGEPCADMVMGKPRDKYCKWCGARMGGET